MKLDRHDPRWMLNDMSNGAGFFLADIWKTHDAGTRIGMGGLESPLWFDNWVWLGAGIIMETAKYGLHEFTELSQICAEFRSIEERNQVFYIRNIKLFSTLADIEWFLHLFPNYKGKIDPLPQFPKS